MSAQKRSRDGSLESSSSSNSTLKRFRRCVNDSRSIINYDPTIRSGKIQKIVLENFMCHEKLIFMFHKRVNFIVGSNGSGKSAIITAIVLGLGGNARSTNRSTNIQKFIKNGESLAKIEIELENGGSRAYKYDVYGDTITIIRTIRQSGSSQYTLKDYHGKVISTRLDDLHQMMMFFSIRVENPIFMLNQEKARELLKELDPKKNYELFLKASQFDLIFDSLSACREFHNNQTSQLNSVQSQIAIEEKEIAAMKHKLQLSSDVETMRKRIEETEISYVWCSVVNLEKEIQQMVEIIDKIKEKSKSLSEFASKKEDLTKTLKEQLIEKNQSLTQLQEQHDENDRNFHKIKNEVSRTNEQLRIIQSNLLSHQKRLEYEKVELSQLDSHMQNIDEHKHKAVDLMETNKQKIQKLNEKHEENKVVMENAKRDLVILRNNLEQLREEKLEITQEVDVIFKQINNITGHINTLKVNTCNKLAIYGRNIVAFVNDIEEMYKQGQFSEMPRGPVGSYIKVPNEKFRNIVEHVLKSRLHSFIVNSNKDRATLNELIKNKHPNIKSPIITTTFSNQVYSVAKGRVKPPSNTTLLMDEINCSDPVVMNLLIDTIRIETILITDSKAIAEELTANVENVPPNLSRVMVPKMNLEYVAAPNYSMYSQRIGRASLLQVDVNDRIRQLIIEKNAVEKKRISAQNSMREISRNLEDLEMKYKEKRKLITTRENNIRQLLDERDELENFVYPHVPDFVILQNEYKEKEKKIAEFNEKLTDMKIKLDAFTSVKNEKQQAMEIIEKSLREHENNKQQEKEDYENIQLQLHNMDYTMKQNDRKLENIKNLLITKNNELKKLKRDYDKKKSLALDKGEYIPTDKSEEDLTTEIKTLKKKIQQYENLRIDPCQLAIELEQKNQHINEKYHQYKIIKESIKLLFESYHGRKQVLFRLLRHVATYVEHVFTKVCLFREIDGYLVIDHKNHTIDIEVTPRANQQHDYRMSTTRVLSGGERSFTTVALLSALWSSTNHPFYFLDEYDVFTDEVVRHYITKVLIQEGERNPNRQYFFLTPQDTTIDQESDVIKIHKLAPPVRT